MAQCWKYKHRLLVLISALAIPGLNLFPMGRALTQVVPDKTLGAESSIVTPRSGSGNVMILGGAKRGTNLFHSFSQFSVPTKGTTYFNNALSIQNIIARITGGSASNIDGLIKANGTANLFLINPNGIVFGPNAALNVGGSFVASTASSLKFADGTEFSATNPQTSPLLTVSVPIGLQFKANPGSILNQSQATDSNGNTVGLQLLSGQTLALVGGNINFDNGVLQAPGSRVELGGLAGAGTVGLNVDAGSLSLSFPNDVARANVSLTNGSEVNVRAGGGGSIVINAYNFGISGGGGLVAGIGSGLGVVDSKAGDIGINATDTVTIDGTTSTDFSSGINDEVLGSGTAGNILINTGTLNIIGNAQISSLTNGQGNAGSVTIRARDQVFISGATRAVASTVGQMGVGNGSEINIQTQSLSLSDYAFITSDTLGQGKAGNIQINASGPVSFDRVGSVFSTGAVGNGGDINVTASSLSLTNGGNVFTLTYGKGNAGNVTINASGPVSFDGISSRASSGASFEGTGNGGDINITASSLSLTNDASLEAGTLGQGKGGNINVTVGSLSLTNGASLSASTSGQGNAGNVTINASGPVSFNGIFSNASSGVSFRATGNGGDINITARSLSLTNSAFLDAVTLGQGKGGNINVTASSLSLTNSASMNTSTGGKGNAGSVTINASGPVSFDRRSSVFSTVESGAMGNGGDINVTASSLSLTNGAELEALTRGNGNSGGIQVKASDFVNLSGVSPRGFSSGLFTGSEATASGQGSDINITTGTLNISNGAVLSARTRNALNGGNIFVNANTLELTNGAELLTTTFSNGRAGNIIVKVSDGITISGSDPAFFDRLNRFGSSTVDPASSVSGLFANTASGSTGQGGDISIDPNQLTIKDGATVAVSSLGKGNAGNLQIQAGIVTLDSGSSLSAATASTEGGNINLKAQDLLLRHGSLISATAGTAQAGGNGGNITLNTPLLVAVPSENSDIRANAFSGNGGQVTVNASGLFGTQFQKFVTPQSDITASSQFGVNGTVNINTPNVNPSNGLVTLPAVVVDPSRQVAQGCSAGEGTTNSQFTVTGRGGLPPNPGEVLSRNAVLADTRLPTTTVHPKSTASVTAASSSAIGTLPAPATGVIFNSKGQATLIAEAPTTRLEIPWLAPHTCR